MGSERIPLGYAKRRTSLELRDMNKRREMEGVPSISMPLWEESKQAKFGGAFSTCGPSSMDVWLA